jgi:DnaJ-class molecular chaperone
VQAVDDPYKTLGVARDATQDQIKSAYRKLARKLHPDLNPGNKQAEERFKKVGAANDLLSDPATRARFDAGEIDANGAERPRANSGAWGGGGRGGGEGFPFGEDASDFLSEMLRRRAQGAGRRGFTYGDFDDSIRGADAHYLLRITLPEAALGTTKRIGLASGKNLDVKVPAGTEEGAVLRLKSQGGASPGGGPAGDALIEIRIEPHPLFTRHGDDIAMTLPVTIVEAALGAKVTVPTLDGRVTLTVPPGSNTGSVLRLKGKGGAKGRSRSDLLVTLEVKLPEAIDPELEAFLRKWSATHPYPVRGKIDGAS